MPDQPQWYIALEWVQATQAAISRECHRLEHTIRYRLGRAVLELLSRPWGLASTLRRIAALAREEGRGFEPIDLDPIVIPPPIHERDEGGTVVARSEAQQLWFEAHQIAHSRAYMLGAFLD